MSTLSEWQSDPSSASFLTSAYIQQALSNVTHATLEKKLVDDVFQAKEAADQQLKSLIRENLGTFIDSQDAMRAIIGADRQLFSGEALQAIVAVFEDGREQCEELVQPIMSAHQQLHLTRQVRELLLKFQTVTAVPSILYKACGVRVPAAVSSSSSTALAKDDKKKKKKKKKQRTSKSGTMETNAAAPSGSENDEDEESESDEEESESEDEEDDGLGLGLGGGGGMSLMDAGGGLGASTHRGGPSACSTGLLPGQATTTATATAAAAAGGEGKRCGGYHLEQGEELIWWYGTPLARIANPEERRRRLEHGAARRTGTAASSSSSSSPSLLAARQNAISPASALVVDGESGVGGRDVTLDIAVLQFRRALLFLEEHYDLEHGVWRDDAISRRASSAATAAGAAGEVERREEGRDDDNDDDGDDGDDDRRRASAADEDLPSMLSGGGKQRWPHHHTAAGQGAREEAATREMAHRLFLYQYSAALLRAAFFFQDHLGGDHLLYAKPSDTVLIEDVLNMMMEIAIGTVKLKGFARALSQKLGGLHHPQHELPHARLRSQYSSAPGHPPASGLSSSGAAAATTTNILQDLHRAGAALGTRDAASSGAGGAGASVRRGAASLAGGTAVSAGTSEMMTILAGHHARAGVAPGGISHFGVGADGVASAAELGCGLWHPVQYYIELTHVQYHQLVWERMKPLCRRAVDFMDRLGKTGSSPALDMLARHQLSQTMTTGADMEDDTARQSASPLSRGFTEVSAFRQEREASTRYVNDSFVGSIASQAPSPAVKTGGIAQLPPPQTNVGTTTSLGPRVGQSEGQEHVECLPGQASRDAANEDLKSKNKENEDNRDRSTIIRGASSVAAPPSFALSEGEASHQPNDSPSQLLRAASASPEPWSTSLIGGGDGGFEGEAVVSAEEASRRLLHCLTSAFQPLLADGGANKGVDVGGSALASPSAFFLRDTTLHAHVVLPPSASQEDGLPPSGNGGDFGGNSRTLDVTPILLASCDQMEQHVVLLLEKLQDRSETEAHVMAIPLYTDACQLVQDTLASLEHVVSHYWTGIAQGIHGGLFDFFPSPGSMLSRLLEEEMALAAQRRRAASEVMAGAASGATTSPLYGGAGGATTTVSTASPRLPTPSVFSQGGGGGGAPTAASTATVGAGAKAEHGYAPACTPHKAESSTGHRSGTGIFSAAGAAGGGVSSEEDARIPPLRFIPLLVGGHVDFAAMRRSKGELRGERSGLHGEPGEKNDMNNDDDDDDDDDDDYTEPKTLREYSMLRIRHLIRSAGVTLRSIFMAFMNQSMVRVFVPMLQQFTQEDLIANDRDERIELCAGVLVEVFLGQWEQMLSLLSDAVLRMKIAVGETFSATIAVEDIHPDAVSTAMMDVSKVLAELEALRSACVKGYFRGVGMLMNAYVSLFPVMRRTGNVTLERRVRARLSREHLSSSATNKLLNALSVLLDRTVPFLRRHVEVYNSEDLFSTSQTTERNSGGDRRQRRRRADNAGADSTGDPSHLTTAHGSDAKSSPTLQMAQYHRLLVSEHIERHGKYVAQLCGDLFLMFVDMIHMKSQLVCNAEANLSEEVRQREVVECMADLLCLSSTVAPLFVDHILSPCLLAVLLTLNPEISISDRLPALRRAESDFQEEYLSRAEEHAQLVLNAILQMHLVLPQQRITRAVYRDGIVRPGVDWQRVSRHTTSTVRPYLTDALVTIAEANEALHWIQQPALASAVTQKLLVHLSTSVMAGLTVNANYVELLSAQCSADFFEHGALLLEAEVFTVCQLLDKVKRATPAEHVLPELPTAEASLRQWYMVVCQHFSTMRRACQARLLSISHPTPGVDTADDVAGEYERRMDEAEYIQRREEMVQEALHHLEYMLEVIIASQWAAIDDREENADGDTGTGTGGSGTGGGAGRKKKNKKKLAGKGQADGEGEGAMAAEGKVVQPLPSSVTESIVQRLAARLEAHSTKADHPNGSRRSSPPQEGKAGGGATARKQRNSVSFRAAAGGPEVPTEASTSQATSGVTRGGGKQQRFAGGGDSPQVPTTATFATTSTSATPKQTMTTFVFPVTSDADDGDRGREMRPQAEDDSATESEGEGEEKRDTQAVDDATLLYMQVVRKGKRLLQKAGKDTNDVRPGLSGAGSSQGQQRPRLGASRSGWGQSKAGEGGETRDTAATGAGGGGGGRRLLARRSTAMGGSSTTVTAPTPGGLTPPPPPGAAAASERRRHRFTRTKAI